jgi:CBS domain containing-hemolysin-like protein
MERNMKKENEFKNLVEETRKKEKIKKEHVNVKWIITIVIVSFVLSFCLSFIANSTIPNLSLILGIIVTFIFILIGILFDIIGVAVTTADEAVFHSMNSRKVKGAKVAVKFKKNADKVSSFCCDVIGDVCGVISGAAGTTIAATLIAEYGFNVLLVGLLVTAIISSLTIGGKAIGKSFAINKSDIILYEFAKIVSNFYKG